MRQGLRIGNIVDGYEFDARVAERRPENVSADSPKPVDAHFHCHESILHGFRKLICRPTMLKST